MTLDDLLQSPDPYMRDIGTDAQQLKNDHDLKILDDARYASRRQQLLDMVAQGQQCDVEDGKLQLDEVVGYLAQFLAVA